MEILLTLVPGKPLAIPPGYHYQVQSAIYALLRQTDLHDSGADFCFGALHGTHDYRAGRLCFRDAVTLEIRTVSEETGGMLRDAIVQRGSIRLFDTGCMIERMEITRTVIAGGDILVQTDSPILAMTREPDGHTVCHAPGDPAFARCIAENYRRKYVQHFGAEPVPLRITPTGRCRKSVTQFKGTWLTAYGGRFRMQGDPAGLTLLYQAGIGQRNAQGFGLFSVL